MPIKSRRQFLKYGTLGMIAGSTPFILSANDWLDFKKSKYNGEFLEACIKGDLGKVKTLIAGDNQLMQSTDQLGRSGFVLARLNYHPEVAEYLKNAGYETDLHEAVLDRDWDRFEMLLGEESEQTARMVNADHPLGGSAMWAAAAGGAGSDMWRIYGNCGDPNLSYKSGSSTPLQKALQYPDLAVAEMTAAALLSNHANPNPPKNEGKIPLHLVAERGSVGMTEMLIRLGADIEIKDDNGKTASQVAEKFGHQEVWKMLNDHDKIPRTCRTSRTAIDVFGKDYEAEDINDIPLYLRNRFVGKSHFNLEYVQTELKANPLLVHSVATTSERCVEACAHTGQKPVVEFLLEHGAPYSLPTAVLLNDFSSVKRMLDEDPQRIYERGAHDFALLWYPAIGRCDLKMTQLLLDRGAKVEEQHFLGTTALHWACRRGMPELVELLVENGADVNRPGRKFAAEGETPLQMVKDEKIAKFLKSRGAG